MERTAAKEYVVNLEYRIDKALKLWKKSPKLENGEVIKMRWEFETSDIKIDAFWMTDDERIEVKCMGSRNSTNATLKGFNTDTERQVMHYISNFAQWVQGNLHRDALSTDE